MKTTSALLILILFSLCVPASAQTKKDTMDILVIECVPAGNSVSIKAKVVPYGNPGYAYFELPNGQSDGLMSFSGQNEQKLSISIPNLNPNTSYIVKIIVTNEKGQILNQKELEFKTKKKSPTSVRK